MTEDQDRQDFTELEQQLRQLMEPGQVRMDDSQTERLLAAMRRAEKHDRYRRIYTRAAGTAAMLVLLGCCVALLLPHLQEEAPLAIQKSIPLEKSLPVEGSIPAPASLTEPIPAAGAPMTLAATYDALPPAPECAPEDCATAQELPGEVEAALAAQPESAALAVNSAVDTCWDRAMPLAGEAGTDEESDFCQTEEVSVRRAAGRSKRAKTAPTAQSACSPEQRIAALLAEEVCNLQELEQAFRHLPQQLNYSCPGGELSVVRHPGGITIIHRSGEQTSTTELNDKQNRLPEQLRQLFIPHARR